jgi:hypothetical protein
MKKFTFAIGLLSCMAITAGTILRATLGTNASGDLNKILIGGGFFGLALIFVPGLMANANHENKGSLKTLMASLILLAVGWAFKLFHITSANELVLLGAAIFMFVYLPMTFIKLYKQSAV